MLLGEAFGQVEDDVLGDSAASAMAKLRRAVPLEGSARDLDDAGCTELVFT